MLRVANIMEEGRYSGQHNRIIRVAEILKNKNVQTIVYFPFCDSRLFELKLRRFDITYHKMNLHRPTLAPKYLFKYILSFWIDIFFLLNQLKRDKIHIAHCNGSWQIKGAIAAKLAGVKVVWHLNDTRMPLLVRMVFNILAFFIPEYFILASKRVKKYYLTKKLLSRKPSQIIQAPVDTKKLNHDKIENKGILSKFKGINIILVSNISPVKGIEYFIDMAGILNDSYSNLHFHVVGNTYSNQKKYNEELKRKIRKNQIYNINFHGFCDDVVSYIKEADIFICSSIFEASPTTVWEAMSMAKAIVSTSVGDVPLFLRNDYSGFVVKTRSGEALASKVSILIDKPELRIVFGKRAREIAVKYLDVEICANLHNKVYFSLIQ